MLIGISGGIGSGKSVVSEILRVMGRPVYDCDSEAKRIMDTDCGIHSSLCARLHPEAVVDGRPNRALISEIVFADPESLAALNEIVHGAVFADIARWRASHSDHRVLFVESAIMRSSGLSEYIDAEWHVTAPLEVRIERVQRRSSLTREQVLARIDSQSQEDLSKCEENLSGDRFALIDNSPSAALLPQLHRLLEEYD